MKDLLLDPRLFPVVIILMFALAALRYALDKNWGQVMYWVGALMLNIAVTFFTGSK